jgi:putative acetyltransferase
MEIRRYKPGEERCIWDVYYSSTHNVVAAEYTSEQVNRWAPDDYDPSRWAIRLKASNPFVAIVDHRIVGFAELLDSGEIDYFYCHHEYQRQGAGSALLHAVETNAGDLGLSELTAKVSTTAVDFFLHKGFRILEETNNIVCGAPAKQFRMAKQLRSI